MTFQDDNGNILEVDGQFAMTKQAVSIFDGSLVGDVSVNFLVDNNSVNREVLNYEGPQMLNQVAFTRQAFSRIRNGNVIDRGYIVIQSEDKSSLNCFYISGNSNWIQLVQGIITDLDFEGITNGKNYLKTLSASSVFDLATEGIVFPVADWVYNLNRGYNVYQMHAITGLPSASPGTGTYSASTDRSGDPNNSFFDMYPCFYVHSLVTEICQQNGLKIDGSLVDDGEYKSLVITPSNGLLTRNPFKDVNLVGSAFTTPGAGNYKYTAFTEVNDPDGLFSNNSYTANKAVGLWFTIKITSSTVAYPDSVDIVIYKNGLPFASMPAGFNDSVNKSFSIITAVSGDVFEIYAGYSLGAATFTLSTVKIEVATTITVDDYVSPEYFLPDYKGIDILKFCFNYFGCSVYFDEYSKTITANIIENFVTEDADDWSTYYLSHRSEYTVEQAQNNYMVWDNNENDIDIVNYNKKHDLKYGAGNLQTRNSLKKENTMFSFPFAQSEFGLGRNNFWLTNIPLVNLKDDIAIPFTAITYPGAGFGDFTVADSTLFFDNECVRVSLNGSDYGYFTIVSKPTATTVRIVFPYTLSLSGYFYKQTFEYNTTKPRLLTVNNNMAVSGFSDNSSFTLANGDATSSSQSNVVYGVFTKPKINDTLDQWTNNLAIDNPDSGGFTDPTIKQLYFNKISKFLQNPNIRASMILPESVYQGFKFDQFIYLKTETLTGYFFVQSIVNYVDSDTPCEINLYML